METRFDELELLSETVAPISPPALTSDYGPTASNGPAPRYRRTLAFLADASLFFALFFALLPLGGISIGELRDSALAWPQISAVVSFLLLLSYFYHVGAWLIWGRTIGGAIFDVRIVADKGQPADVRSASKRWLGMLVSGMTGGLGFMVALLPGSRSLSDRLSRTRAICTQ